ncbi:flagellar biosynthesis protein FlhA [Litoribrevibacter euphylliae]|uniref:Flagellar biosynthesis protein FlhA n=1 Tax=Litoribrevibacter euphylliae TaxID=1834034 RepID=A0ABV7HB50_9GAMM
MLYTARNIFSSNMGVPILLLTLLAMMTLPVPPFILDVLFTFNIALSLVVLLVGVYALRPLEFAVFPTILLVATLLRLALNVASTRVVLLEGHQGGDAAGKVIEAFGEVVIGGNYAVGLVVFLILMIINFVVVTKGAGRISEVSARFTLDAMPGKQMAIDADLNAGLIDQAEAKQRRAEISQEADFYGSMDGASKFVRGDAVAGILILLINLIGGLAIGMGQHGLEFADAVEKYSLLTIGDGLVAQIPSLLLSTAAAIMVTRVNTAEEMREQVMGQMFDSPKALSVSAALLIVMGLVPGMPHVAFIGLGLLAAGIAAFIYYRKRQKEEGGADQIAKAGELLDKDSPQGAMESRAEEVKELSWDDVTPVDPVGLEVGYRLIPMVDKNQGGMLLNRIKGVRKKLSQEIGFLMPSVHIRDNLDLLPNVYRISLMGVTVGEAEIHPDKDLAINPGQVFGEVDGIPTKDPAFGLDAFWIDPALKDKAQTLGYTVVDASTVVATHLNQLLFKHADELIGHEEVQQLMDLLSKKSPKLAEELVPNTLTLSALLKVLQNLLSEQVPIRDMRTIAEAVIEAAARGKDPSMLTEAVRLALSRMIVQNIVGGEQELPVITLEPGLENILLQSVQQAKQAGAMGDDSIVLEPSLAERLQSSVSEAAQRQELAGKSAVLLVSPAIRAAVAKFVKNASETLSVLSYNEVPDNKKITIVAAVGS